MGSGAMNGGISQGEKGKKGPNKLKMHLKKDDKPREKV